MAKWMMGPEGARAPNGQCRVCGCLLVSASVCVWEGAGSGGGWVVGGTQQERAKQERKKCARENDQEITQKRGAAGRSQRRFA